MPRLRFSNSLSTEPEAETAEERTVAALLDALGGPPDLLIFFSTHHYATALEGLGSRLQAATGARTVAGCTGHSLAGGGQEVEGRPSLVLWGACLGDTRVHVEHLSARAGGNGAVNFHGSPRINQAHRAGLVLLADPFTFPAHLYLPELSGEFPDLPIVGGMASGGQGPHQNLLWRGGECLDHGALALSIEGDVVLETVVSQGCRPVGEPLVVTACDGPVIQSLRGKRADKALFEVLESLPERDKELFKRGAHVGMAIDPTRSRFEAEDLLVRNLRGIDPKQGAVIVGDDSLRVGMTVQFMVRDATSASDELDRLLRDRAGRWSPAAGEAGALLFTCGGRGTSLFRTANHDAGAVQEHLGPGLPLAGFACAGEIGPISGQTFLHGFTACTALFRARDEHPLE